MQLIHRIIALLGGYFWLPCPIDGTVFGGHQWKDRKGLSGTLYLDFSHGVGICPKCAKAGRGNSPFDTEEYKNFCKGLSDDSS